MAFPILRTQRLLLRPLTVQDEEWMIRLHQDPEVMRFSPKGVLSDEEVRKALSESFLSYERYGFGRYSCWLQESATPIGFCGVLHVEIDGIAYPELGYRLFPSFWSKGYATEAATAIKEDVFTRERLPQIYSLIDPCNTRSIRVAEKLGEKLAFYTIYKNMRIAMYTVKNPLQGEVV